MNRILVLALAATCAGCDYLPAFRTGERGYAACLRSSLGAAHTSEASLALIGACRKQFPGIGTDVIYADVAVTGRASVDSELGATSFSGTLYNVSSTKTVTAVVVRLTPRPTLASPFVDPSDAAASAPARPAWTPPALYRVPVVMLPQSTGTFTIPIMPGNYGGDWAIHSV